MPQSTSNGCFFYQANHAWYSAYVPDKRGLDLWDVPVDRYDLKLRQPPGPICCEPCLGEDGYDIIGRTISKREERRLWRACFAVPYAAGR